MLTEAEYCNRGCRAPQCLICEAHTSKQQLLQFNFYVHASRQVEFHQGIDSLVGRIDDIHQALMRADFELVARSLVDVR